MSKLALYKGVLRYRYLCYLLLLLPVFTFRDYTPGNELRYVSIAEEALNNDTWFIFHNHGEVYADKPPLFFWLIMLSKLISGGYYMWIIGLFSLLPAIGIVVVMDKWLKDEYAKLNPLISNLMLLTTTMFLASVLVIRMDMLMTFFITLSLYTFYRIYKNRHKQVEIYLLPVYIFLAIFTKGPMGILIPVVSIVTFLTIKKQFLTIGHYIGWRQWGILAGLCIIWFALVYIEGGQSYLNNLLFKQVAGRAINSYDHQKPVWYYFPRMLWAFLPWSMLFIVLIGKGILRKAINSDLEKFFLIIIGANIIMLSLISAKLDIYLLPIYPFVIYLCSILLVRYRKDKAIKISIVIPAAIISVSLIVALIFNSKIADLYSYSNVFYVSIVLLIIGNLATLVMLYKKHVLKAVIVMSTSILCSIFAGSFGIPSINKYIGLGEMAKFTYQMTEKEGPIQYASYKSLAILDMDIYLNHPISLFKSVSELDSLSRLDRKTVLFFRNNEIHRDKEFSRLISKFRVRWSSKDFSMCILGNTENSLNLGAN